MPIHNIFIKNVYLQSFYGSPYVPLSVLSLNTDNLTCVYTSIQQRRNGIHDFSGLICTYHIKTTSIVTSCNLPYFYDYLLTKKPKIWLNGIFIFSGDEHCFWNTRDPTLSRGNCTNKISLPVLRLPFKVTNLSTLSTSKTYPLCMSTLTYVTVFIWMTYLHPFDHTDILSLCTTIYQLKIPSLSISTV